MDPLSIIADATAIAKLIQLALQAGVDAMPFVLTLKSILIDKTALTDAQRAAMQAQADALTAQLNATAIPADQP